jgi:hypothetical protein
MELLISQLLITKATMSSISLRQAKRVYASATTALRHGLVDVRGARIKDIEKQGASLMS